MIKTEKVKFGGHYFMHTYSDAGFFIHGGNPEADYAEAYDPEKENRTYAETDRLINPPEDDKDKPIE